MRCRGGGVCFYVRRGLKCSLMSMSGEGTFPAAEFLFLKIQTPHDYMLIGVVYKPPNASFRSNLEDNIFSLTQNYNNIIVMGDFSCDLNGSSSVTNYLKSMTYSAGLTVVPYRSTHHLLNSSTRIDAMFVSGLEKVRSFGQHSVEFLSSHDLIHIEFEFELNKLKLNQQPIIVRNLRNIDDNNFLLHLSNHEWAGIFSKPDINVKVYKLTLFLTLSFDAFAPLHLSSLKKRFSPWMTNVLIALIIKERNKLRSKFRKTKQNINQVNFRRIRNLAKTRIRDAYNKYNFDIIKNKSKS